MGRGLRVGLLAALLGLLAVGSASAEPGYEYGEVVRFGGFDSRAYNRGEFGGEPTPGKFLDPTGFAVDPVDNTVYVADRTSKAGHDPTSWRIQQFSPQGELLGATTFTLKNSNFFSYALEGLAVDHRAGRLYALVIGKPPSWSPYPGENVAQEILAWSTTPVCADEHCGLVAAEVAGGKLGEQLPLDTFSTATPGEMGTVGGVVSSSSQMVQPGVIPLYAPQGIAIDPLNIPNVDNPVAIEASDLIPGAGRGHPIPGDTIVQQVATQSVGATIAGELLSQWSGESVAGELGGISWGPLGLATAPDGTLTALLDASGSTSTSAYAVRLNANLGQASVLDSDANVPPTSDFDQAPFSGDEELSPFYSLAGSQASDFFGAGPQVVELSESPLIHAAGLYAAIIFSTRIGDRQVGLTSPEGPEYWRPGEASEGYEANLGVRLLAEPEPGAPISSLQGRTIVNTLGNNARSGPCNIGASWATLAAGSDGTLWVLDRGPRADQPGMTGQGREIIELAPDAGRLCPQPSGTFTMTSADGTSVPGSETLTVTAGTQVTFSAKSVNLRHGKPFAYEWDLDGSTTSGPAHDGFSMVYEMGPPHYFYPPSSITYTYTRPGRYTVGFRMRTDYGIYTPEQSGTVEVLKAPSQPQASFTAAPSGPQQVTFNASSSSPGVGSIVNYHWNWGDGSEEDEGPQAPVVAHTYAAPGVYHVQLTVTNSAYQSAASEPQTITVTAPPPRPNLLTDPLYPIPPVPPVLSVPPNRSPTRLVFRARLAGRAVAVTLTCPRTKQSCTGTVKLTTAALVAIVTRGHKGHKGRTTPHRGHLVLGQAPFAITGGHETTVNVRLSAAGLSLLRRSKRLEVVVTVSAHDTLGDPGTASARVALVPTGSARGQRHGTAQRRR